MLFNSSRDESDSEEDKISACDDQSAVDECNEDQGKGTSPATCDKEMSTGGNDEPLKESSGRNISSNVLDADSESDDPLSPADSNVESLLSESTVINRIMEEDALCNLADNIDDISAKDGANKDNEGEAEKPVGDEKVAKVIPFPNNSQYLQSKSIIQSCTELPGLESSVVDFEKLPFQQGKLVQKQLILLPNKKSRDESAQKVKPMNMYEQKESEDVQLPTRQRMEASPPPPPRNKSSSSECRTLSLKQIMPPPSLPPHRTGISGSVERIVIPIRQIMSSSTTPSSQFRGKKILVPRPALPQNLGVCFTYINRGCCNRSKCTYHHKVMLVLGY